MGGRPGDRSRDQCDLTVTFRRRRREQAVEVLAERPKPGDRKTNQRCGIKREVKTLAYSQRWAVAVALTGESSMIAAAKAFVGASCFVTGNHLECQGQRLDRTIVEQAFREPSDRRSQIVIAKKIKSDWKAEQH
jgi:hypothetical protein